MLNFQLFPVRQTQYSHRIENALCQSEPKGGYGKFPLVSSNSTWLGKFLRPVVLALGLIGFLLLVNIVTIERTQAQTPVLSIVQGEVYLEPGTTMGTYIVKATPPPTSNLDFDVSVTYGDGSTTDYTRTYHMGNPTETISVPIKNASDFFLSESNLKPKTGSNYTLHSDNHSVLGSFIIPTAAKPGLTLTNTDTNNTIEEGETANFKITATHNFQADQAINIVVRQIQVGPNFLSGTLVGRDGTNCWTGYMCYQPPVMERTIPMDMKEKTFTVPTTAKDNITISEDNPIVIEARIEVDNFEPWPSFVKYQVSSNKLIQEATVRLTESTETPVLTIATETKFLNEGGTFTFTVSADPMPTSQLAVTFITTESDSKYLQTNAILPTPHNISANQPSNSWTVTVSSSTTDGDGKVVIELMDTADYNLKLANSVTVENKIIVAVYDTQTPRPSITIESDSSAPIAEASIGQVSFTVTSSRSASVAGLSIRVAVTETWGNYLLNPSSAPVNAMIESSMTTGTYIVLIRRSSNSKFDPDGEIRVELLNDNISPSSYTVDSSSDTHFDTVVIADFDRPTDGISVASQGTEVTEGGTAIFQITAPGTSTQPRQINIRVTGLGSFFADDIQNPETATIGAGKSTEILQFATDDDSIFEPDQTITVTVLAGSGYTVTSKVRTGSTEVLNAASLLIKDNETAPAGVSIHSLDTSISEGGMIRLILVNGSGNFDGTGTVAIAVAGDTGFLTDTTNRLVTPTSGGRVHEVPIRTNNDTNDEANGVLTFTITSVTGYTKADEKTSVTVAVADNDVPVVTVKPVLPQSKTSIVEGEPARFIFTTDIAPHQNLQVEICYSDSVNISTDCSSVSELTRGEGDFIDTTGSNRPFIETVNMSAGAASVNPGRTIEVKTLNDNTIEAMGSIRLEIQYMDATNDKSLPYTSANTGANEFFAEVPISDNDPEITISSSLERVEEGGTFDFIINSSAEVTDSNGLDVTVNISRIGNFLNFGANSGEQTITIEKNQTSKSYQITTIQNSNQTGDGTITMEIIASTSDPKTYFLGEKISSTVTVQDADIVGVEFMGDDLIVREGEMFNLTVVADAIPQENLMVNVSLTDPGNYLANDLSTNGITFNFETSGTTTTIVMPIQTLHDSNPEPDNKITAVIDPNPTNYRILAKNSVKIVVRDVDGGMTTTTVSISAVEGSITEGEEAQFRLTADLEPSRDLIVRLQFFQTTEVTFMNVPSFVVIRMNESEALVSIDTLSHTDVVGGTITAQVVSGTGYQPDPQNNSADVVVIDDNEPTPNRVVSLASIALQAILEDSASNSEPSAESEIVNMQSRNSNISGTSPAPPVISVVAVSPIVDEGSVVRFRISASHSSRSVLRISITVDSSQGYVAEPTPAYVNLAAGEKSAGLVIPTIDDDIAKPNGLVTASLNFGQDYEVDTLHHKATVTVSDAVDRLRRGDQIRSANRVVLPELLGSLSAGSLVATERRMELAPGLENRNSFSFGGATIATDILTTGGELLNEGTTEWRTLLGDSAFSVELLPEDEFSNSPVLWGMGDFHEISNRGIGSSDRFSGELLSGHFGLESSFDDGLVIGLATSLMESDVVFGNNDDERIEYTANSVGLHPYFGVRSPNDRNQIQLVVGYGEGEIVLNQKHYQNETIDSRYQSIGLSGSRNLLKSDGKSGYGQSELSVSGGTWYAMQHIGGVEGVTDESHSNVGHTYVEIELEHNQEMSALGTYGQSVSGGVRRDKKNDQSYFGVELGTQANIELHTGWSITGIGKNLLSDSTSSKNWRLSLLVEYDSNADDLGLIMSINPHWKQLNENLNSVLWNSDVLRNNRFGSLGENEPPFESEIGYGFSILEDFGRLTPYGGFGLIDQNQSEVRIGSRLFLGTYSHFELEGKQRTSFARDEQLGLKIAGSVNW